MRILLAVLVVSGCARADLGGGTLDAEPAADPDAAAPDGAPGGEDAAEVVADAAEVVADAAVPDAAEVVPDAAPPPDACVPSWIALSANGGFDAGVAPWAQQGTVITDDAGMPISPQAGTHAAWFGGTNAADDRLVQTVAVPADATALRVRLYECFVTADVAGEDDHFTASLRVPGGAELEVLRAASNLQVGTVCGWTAATWTAASPHAGTSVELALRGTTDAAYPTSWYVDTLVVEALACP